MHRTYIISDASLDVLAIRIDKIVNDNEFPWSLHSIGDAYGGFYAVLTCTTNAYEGQPTAMDDMTVGVVPSHTHTTYEAISLTGDALLEHIAAEHKDAVDNERIATDDKYAHGFHWGQHLPNMETR